MSHTQRSPTFSLVENGATAVSLPNSYADGIFTVYASGDFGGGTLGVSISPDGTTWFPALGGNLDEPGYLPFAGVLCRHVRFTLANATDPAINVTVLF